MMNPEAVRQVKKLHVPFAVVEQRVSSAYRWFSAHWGKLVILICLALTSLAFRWAMTDNIVVGPFSVPKVFEERGYTSEAISTAVVQLIHANNSTVSLRQTAETDEETDVAAWNSQVDDVSILDNVEGQHVVSSFDIPTTASITVPLTSMTLGSMAEVIRSFLGRKTTAISGQIVFDDEERESLQEGRAEPPQLLIRYNVEYPELSTPLFGKRWWSRRTSSIASEVTARNAEDAVQKLAYIAADGINQRRLLRETEQSDSLRYINRGNAYIGLQDYERASRMFEQANELLKFGHLRESAHAYLALGWIAEQKRDYKDAREAYCVAASFPETSGGRLDDDVAWARVYLVNLNVKERRQVGESIKDYNAILDTYRKLGIEEARLVLNGTSVAQVSVHNNLGFLHLSIQDWENAERNFNAGKILAERIRADARKCAYGNIMCQSTSNDNEQVNSLAILNVTNNQIAISDYGLARLNGRNSTDVSNLKEHYYLQAMEADPAHARTHFKLGRLYAHEKRYQEAEEQFRKAARLDPRYKKFYEAWNASSNKKSLSRPS